MRTEELISRIATEAGPPERQSLAGVAWPLLVALAISVTLFSLILGVRANAVASLSSPRFVFKFVVTGVLLLTAASALPALARPGGDIRRIGLLWLAPALLVVAVVMELVATPSRDWAPRAIGSNALVCLTMIPLMALAPITALLFVMRHWAPTRPALAGAVAGLAGCGASGLLYASHCPDDSPLFLAIWYVIAMALSTGLATLAARRWLRW